MLVSMLTKIGGYRNGLEWPDRGGTIDVPDHEAADLIANGYAEPATAEEAPDAPDPADDVPTAEALDDEASADDDQPEPSADQDEAPAEPSTEVTEASADDDQPEPSADQDEAPAEPSAEVTDDAPKRSRKPKV